MYLWDFIGHDTDHHFAHLRLAHLEKLMAPPLLGSMSAPKNWRPSKQSIGINETC
jgi:hypothetical protein